MTEHREEPAETVRNGELRAWSPTRSLKPAPRLAYESPGYRRLLGLHAVNTLLTVATLSVWRFWASSRVRRLLWAHIRFDGEPLEYTGDGLEIFVGFLKVIVLILLPVAVVVTSLQVAVLDSAPGLTDALSLVYALGLFWLVALGRYLSLRYRTSRTRWRGIRGRLAGSVRGYLWLTLWTYLATFMTFGFFKPWMDARRIRYALHGARAGNLPVDCRITGGSLFWSWLVAWLLWPFSFGLSYFWYRARMFRMTADRTGVGPLRLGFTASGWQHAWLWLGNGALLFGPALLAMLALMPGLFATLEAVGANGGQPDATDVQWRVAVGILPVYAVFGLSYLLLMPVIWERRIRFTCRHLVVLGTIDLAAVRQADDDATLAGEGLAGDFDAF
ncbi:hypothetical protein GCM10017083_54740 [Thalassobaculum fulvum]|uniref:DUF898 domain-containing protein n=1 Tax=Thalassobaculum fulvum TaxID=1633335 RepID=A0A918XYB8_9PROT|nr:DUF898 family protein [Thalassobaculum fulvum]GHD63830.1 hypothetical protein GCM10017083_54740 [Thalassobaculum fulvum]